MSRRYTTSMPTVRACESIIRLNFSYSQLAIVDSIYSRKTATNVKAKFVSIFFMFKSVFCAKRQTANKNVYGN